MREVVSLDSVTHRYGERLALERVSFDVGSGECLGVLGPNGGGKTTLFKILSTLLTPTDGRATLCGCDVVRQRAEVRQRIGVVFQSPSLDVYLTARENLRHGGHLYGLSGRALESRIDEMLSQLGVADRAGDLVRTLSGGLKRRVELAKSLLHHPVVLLLDEPSTGLDPGARKDLWAVLESLRCTTGVTILMTTHFMLEAERCDRLALLDAGRLVTVGTTDELKSRIGGDCLTLECEDAANLAARVEEQFGCVATVVDGSVRIERSDGHAMVPRIAEAFGPAIRSVTVGKPTLQDVFMHETGHRFDDNGSVDEAAVGAAGRRAEPS
ncbi:MAG: ATP-binding cassette domain-containing protein [Phycisphaerae bacterium]